MPAGIEVIRVDTHVRPADEVWCIPLTHLVLHRAARFPSLRQIDVTFLATSELSGACTRAGIELVYICKDEEEGSLPDVGENYSQECEGIMT